MGSSFTNYVLRGRIYVVCSRCLSIHWPRNFFCVSIKIRTQWTRNLMDVLVHVALLRFKASYTYQMSTFTKRFYLKIYLSDKHLQSLNSGSATAYTHVLICASWLVHYYFSCFLYLSFILNQRGYKSNLVGKYQINNLSMNSINNVRLNLFELIIKRIVKRCWWSATHPHE